jgi:hypothetical protein
MIEAPINKAGSMRGRQNSIQGAGSMGEAGYTSDVSEAVPVVRMMEAAVTDGAIRSFRETACVVLSLCSP